eukprot:299375-Rhodomonas_salina.1
MAIKQGIAANSTKRLYPGSRSLLKRCANPIKGSAKRRRINAMPWTLTSNTGVNSSRLTSLGSPQKLSEVVYLTVRCVPRANAIIPFSTAGTAWSWGMAAGTARAWGLMACIFLKVYCRTVCSKLPGLVPREVTICNSQPNFAHSKAHFRLSIPERSLTNRLRLFVCRGRGSVVELI